MSSHRVNRRTFLGGAFCAASVVLAGRVSAEEEGVRVAVVGCGGRGADDLNDLKPTGARIVALCDADERRATKSFSEYASARRYQDWRRMLEKEAGNIDAVVVATPDHNHAIISIAAMKLGKHVYCEKPLAHSIWEAREITKVAEQAGVVTQMGTQGHAFEGTRRAVEVFQSDVLGDVRELHVWPDRPK